MRFRPRADPPPPPEPDDPRVAALAAEIGRARRDTVTDYWLMWSGGLLGVGDAVNEATALVRSRWWHFNGNFNPEKRLYEIDEESAAEVLLWLIGNSLAYEVELMPPERAAAFAMEFMSLVPVPRRWFSNGEAEWLGGGRAWAGTPATDFTFDEGVVAVADGRAWIAWFTDEG